MKRVLPSSNDQLCRTTYTLYMYVIKNVYEIKDRTSIWKLFTHSIL